jgi:hypothetical protein
VATVSGSIGQHHISIVSRSAERGERAEEGDVEEVHRMGVMGGPRCLVNCKGVQGLQ